VRRAGSTVSAGELRAHLADRLAHWQLPERWTFVDEIPKTGTGKLDKKLLRAHYADGELTVEQP
jgi:fatty-acyl-CoA synthase